MQLNPDLAEAHVLLAVVYQREWHCRDAEAEFKWALRLRPNDAAAHLGMAKWLLAEGRTEEAMEWSKRARELDSLAVTSTDLAWILFSARRYDEAIKELDATLAVRPDNALALWFLGFSFIGKGSPQAAIPPLERAVSISDGSPGAIGVLARAYGHAGRRSEALRLIGELNRRRQKEYVPTAPFRRMWASATTTRRLPGLKERTRRSPIFCSGSKWSPSLTRCATILALLISPGALGSVPALSPKGPAGV